MQKLKIRTIIGLVLLYVAILLNWQWVWGILFSIWVIPDLFSGITYFMEPVERKTNPVLYWIIVLSWIWMSIYMIALPFFPQLNSQIYKDTHPIKEVGIYKDNYINPQNRVLEESLNNQKAFVSNSEKQPPKDIKHGSSIAVKDSLSYKSYYQKETHFFVQSPIL